MTPEREAYALKRIGRLVAELAVLEIHPIPRPKNVAKAINSKRQSLRRWRKELGI